MCVRSLSQTLICENRASTTGRTKFHMVSYLSVPLLTQKQRIGLVLRGACLTNLISRTEATKNFWVRIHCFQYRCILLTWQLFCNGLQMLCCLSASLRWRLRVKVVHLIAVLQLHMLLVGYFSLQTEASLYSVCFHIYSFKLQLPKCD